MGPHHEAKEKQTGSLNVIRLIRFGLVVAAVVKEVRTPPDQRTWHGAVAGFVPYDFRRPTFARLRERMWAPRNEHLISPNVFGVGWTLNAGRLVTLLRQRFSGHNVSMG